MITRSSQRISAHRENMRGGVGAATLTAVAEALPANLRLFSEIRLEPGASIGFHVHEGETEIFLFVKGSARVMDDDRACILEAGDSLVTPSGPGHSVECIGDEELIMHAAIVLD